MWLCIKSLLLSGSFLTKFSPFSLTKMEELTDSKDPSSNPGGAVLCFFVWSSCQFFYLCWRKRRESDVALHVLFIGVCCCLFVCWCCWVMVGQSAVSLSTFFSFFHCWSWHFHTPLWLGWRCGWCVIYVEQVGAWWFTSESTVVEKKKENDPDNLFFFFFFFFFSGTRRRRKEKGGKKRRVMEDVKTPKQLGIFCKVI